MQHRLSAYTWNLLPGYATDLILVATELGGEGRPPSRGDVSRQHGARASVDLAHGADLLFIEAAFLEADASMAAERGHLTARQAGRLACEAGAKQIVPMHFSPRYVGRDAELRREAQEAFGTR